LAKRSGVAVASVYLIERMGTAGPEDDALMVRALLADRKSKSFTRRLVNEFSPAEHANDASVAAPASEAHPSSYLDESRDLQGACPGVRATC